MKNILVGVDGSPASLDALTWARGLAAASGAVRVVVVSVLEPAAAGETHASRDRHADHTARARDWCRAVPPSPAGITEEVALPMGVPADALVAATARHRADVVVVGAEGTRGRLGPRLGSVAHELAHRLQVPLIVVPVGRPWHGLHEVLVGVDGSEGSVAAVDFLVRLVGLADLAGARVTAEYACQPLSEWAAHPSFKLWYRRAVHDLACWTAPLTGVVAHLDQEVRDEGHPSLTILTTAEEVGADLVVVGGRATDAVTRLHAGSTAFQLLHRATRPILLVPPPPCACRKACPRVGSPVLAV